MCEACQKPSSITSFAQGRAGGGTLVPATTHMTIQHSDDKSARFLRSREDVQSEFFSMCTTKLALRFLLQPVEFFSAMETARHQGMSMGSLGSTNLTAAAALSLSLWAWANLWRFLQPAAQGMDVTSKSACNLRPRSVSPESRVRCRTKAIFSKQKLHLRSVELVV